MVFTVTLSPASDEPVSVEIFDVSGLGTATVNVDYQRFGRETLRFAPGDTRQTFTVRILGDVQLERDETLVVRLDNPVGAGLATGVDATGTIVDDEELPIISIADASRAEGSAIARDMNFAVTLNEARTWPVSVNYATSSNIGSGAATVGTDYLETSGTLRFAAGETRKTITVSVLGDMDVEDDETFTVTLSAPVDAVISTTARTATGTIVDGNNVNTAPTIDEIADQDNVVMRQGTFLRVDVDADDAQSDRLEYWATATGSYTAMASDGVMRTYGFRHATYPRETRKGVLDPDGGGTIEITALKIESAAPFMVTVYVDDGVAETAVESFEVTPMLATLPAPTNLVVKSGTLSSNGFTVTWTGVNAVDPGDYAVSATAMERRSGG